MTNPDTNAYKNFQKKNGEYMATMRMIFTVGLVVGLDEISYKHRYCYHSNEEAVRALNEWDGKGFPPGNWIKRKGIDGDVTNPNYIKE